MKKKENLLNYSNVIFLLFHKVLLNKSANTCIKFTSS